MFSLKKKNLWIRRSFGFFGRRDSNPQLLSELWKNKNTACCLCVDSWFELKHQSGHYIIFAFLSLSALISVFATKKTLFPLFIEKLRIKVQTCIRGDDERCIIWCELLRDFLFSPFFFSSPPTLPNLRAHFSVFFISPPVRFPPSAVFPLLK